MFQLAPGVQLMSVETNPGPFVSSVKLPFSKKEALEGRALLTRNGYPAKITWTDPDGYHEVVAYLDKYTFHYVARPSGVYCSSSDLSERYGATSPWDLFMKGV